MPHSRLNDELFKSMATSIKDVNQAQMLPPIVYTDPEFFEFEKEALFAHEWLCVGRENWIPKHGDYFTGMHMGEPFVLVRQQDNTLKALSTVCQHRAMLVAEGKGNTRNFLCPYHHWGYGLDGQLISAPAMERACDFKFSDVKLPEFKIETWLGFIFINFDLQAPPLAPRLSALTDILANYELERAEGSDEIDSTTFGWNWKVMLENNNDGYHANRLHAGPLHDNVPSDLSVFPTLPEDTAGYYRTNGTLHEDTSFNPTQRAVLPVFPKLTKEERNRMLFGNVPPTLSLVIRSDMIAYIILHANSHDTVTAKRGWLVAPGAMRQKLFRERLKMNLDSSAEIAKQDVHVDGLIPIGLRSRYAARGRYSWQEQAQRELNGWLVKRYWAAWERMHAS